MIVIADNRRSIAKSYRQSFSQVGVAVCDLSCRELAGWVIAATPDDLGAIEAFLIGEPMDTGGVTAVIKRRCGAAVIAMRGSRSLETTLELFADGVDDVVAEPCHVREILARIEAIARRARPHDPNVDGEIEIRTFRDGRDPIVGGEPLKLPRRELRILEYLASSRSRSLTKAQIFNSVYGLFDQQIDETVIESHICKLRRRLRHRLGYDPIESRRHLGYRLVRNSERWDDRDGCRPIRLAECRDDVS